MAWLAEIRGYTYRAVMRYGSTVREIVRSRNQVMAHCGRWEQASRYPSTKASRSRTTDPQPEY